MAKIEKKCIVITSMMARIADGNVKSYKYTGKEFGHFLKYLKINFPYNPVIETLGIYLREVNAYVHTYLYRDAHKSFIVTAPN